MKYLFLITAMVAIMTGCSKKTIEPTPVVEAVPLEDNNEQKAATTLPEEKETTQDNAEDSLNSPLADQPSTQKTGNFKLDDDHLDIVEQPPAKPIMVAVVAPMSGKNDMVGNAIMDGAHMSLISLFEKHKVPVRVQVIDTGSTPEDIEFNISKLDEVDFDVILGLTTSDQEDFVKAYVEHKVKKPLLITLNPTSQHASCIVSLEDQVSAITKSATPGKKIYLVLPASEDQVQLQIRDVEILRYSTKDVKETNADLSNIVKKIDESQQDALVIFTDAGWRLQKFITQIDTNRTKVVLANMSNLNTRMESVNSLRHRIGDIMVVRPDTVEYNKFMQEFNAVNKRKPLELAFWSHNAIQQLKNSFLEDNKWNIQKDYPFCKIDLKVFNRD